MYKTNLLYFIVTIILSTLSAFSNDINLSEMFTELTPGYECISGDNLYFSKILECNGSSSKQYRKGIIEIIDIRNDTKQYFDITSVHEAINKLIWTYDNNLIVLARSTSMHRYICVFSPTKNKIIFEEFTLGSSISISPDQKKIAFIKSLPRTIPDDLNSNTLRVSFNISESSPSSIYPINTEWNHKFYPILKWNHTSDRIAFVEKVEDKNQLVIVSKHDMDLIIAENEVAINDNEIPNEIKWVDDNTVEIQVKVFSKQENTTMKEQRKIRVKPFIN